MIVRNDKFLRIGWPAWVVVGIMCIGCKDEEAEFSPYLHCDPSSMYNRSMDLEAGIDGLVVDQGHAYWLARSDGDGREKFFLRDCQLDDCNKTSRTQLTLDGWPYSSIETELGRNALIASESRLFFWASTDRVGSAAGLYSCPKSDCSQISRIELQGAQVRRAILDGDQLLVSTWEGTLLSCLAEDCDNTITRIQLTAPAGEPSVVHPIEHLAADDEHYYLVSESRLIRVTKDGSRLFEVIARELGPISDIAVTSDSVYWAERLPARVRSCPKTGCVGDPKLVLGSLHDPAAMLIVDGWMYILEPFQSIAGSSFEQEAVPGSNRILRCPAADCSDPKELKSYDNLNGLLIHDGEQLYYRHSTKSYCFNVNSWFGIGTASASDEVSP